jgi:hypothetical protein
MSKIKYEICVIKIKSSPSAQLTQTAKMKAKAGAGRPFVFNYCQGFFSVQSSLPSPHRSNGEQISSPLSDLEFWTTNNKHFN